MGGSKEREDIIRGLLDAVPGGVLRIARDGVIVDANIEAQRLLGYDRDGLVGHSMAAFTGQTICEDGTPLFPPDYRATKLFETGIVSPPRTLGVRHPDGTLSWAVFRVAPEYDDQGVLSGALVTFLDITERKRAEEELRRSEARWRSLGEHLPLFVIIADRNAHIVTINRIHPQFELEKVIGSYAGTYIHEDHLAEWREQYRQCLETGAVVKTENRAFGPDGGMVWYESVLAPIVEEDGKIERVIIVGRDITEQRTMLTRLAEKERLASVGKLAASVAHEVMNPLTYVLGNLDYALGSRCEPGPNMRAALVEAREGAVRLQQIVRDLRTLGRSGVEELFYVDVGSVIEMALRLGGHEITRHATITLELDDAPGVLASESRLCQVFINLLMNAAQALDEVSTPERTIALRYHGEEAGCVGIDVTDNGPGIEPERLKRIFDPFFTTKAKGTGLGLSIAKESLERMGGRLEVRTEVGRGTTFTVWLPTTRVPCASR